jgi:hypothetical protein
MICQDYKPTSTLNGREKKLTVRCYVTLPPFAAEPVLKPGQSWWQTFPPTPTRESNRNKGTRQSSEDEIPDEPISMSLVISNNKIGFQQPAFSLDPWNDKRTFKLFLAVENEHPKDAIARRIDILMDVRIEPEG